MTARADGAAEDFALHASAAVVGERGVLVRGPAGAGKTGLVLALVEAARACGDFARLVADDRTLARRHGGRIVARPHAATAGLAERRGLGIVAAPHEPACVVALVVDLVEGPPERLPAPDMLRCDIAGVALPRLAVRRGTPPAEAAALVAAALTMSWPASGDEPYFTCQVRGDAQDCARAERSSSQSFRQRHER